MNHIQDSTSQNHSLCRSVTVFCLSAAHFADDPYIYVCIYIFIWNFVQKMRLCTCHLVLFHSPLYIFFYLYDFIRITYFHFWISSHFIHFVSFYIYFLVCLCSFTQTLIHFVGGIIIVIMIMIIIIIVVVANHFVSTPLSPSLTFSLSLSLSHQRAISIRNRKFCHSLLLLLHYVANLWKSSMNKRGHQIYTNLNENYLEHVEDARQQQLSLKGYDETKWDSTHVTEQKKKHTPKYW